MNKKTSENELINGMLLRLASPEIDDAINDLDKATDYLNSAIEIFEDVGMLSEADDVLNILIKIANEDPATKGLNSNKMVKNLLDHGTEFNLNADDANLEVSDDYLDFEDEI